MNKTIVIADDNAALCSGMRDFINSQATDSSKKQCSTAQVTSLQNRLTTTRR